MPSKTIIIGIIAVSLFRIDPPAMTGTSSINNKTSKMAPNDIPIVSAVEVYDILAYTSYTY
jgi:hypothetical protein